MMRFRLDVEIGDRPLANTAKLLRQISEYFDIHKEHKLMADVMGEEMPILNVLEGTERGVMGIIDD
jgi:hypothetical protein